MSKSLQSVEEVIIARTKKKNGNRRPALRGKQSEKLMRRGLQAEWTDTPAVGRLAEKDDSSCRS
jgi:hypothetical protein